MKEATGTPTRGGVEIEKNKKGADKRPSTGKKEHSRKDEEGT